MAATNIDKQQWSVILGHDLLNPITHAAPAAASADQSSLTSLLLSGEYSQVLKSSVAATLFGTDLPDTADQVASLSSTLDLSNYLTQQAKSYVAAASSSTSTSAVQDIQSVGIATLFAFIQAGWTGPNVGFQPTDLLPALLRSTEASSSLKKKALDTLSVGGETAYHLTPHIVFLHMARVLLVDLGRNEEFKTLKQKIEPDQEAVVAKTTPWWAMRTLFLQQRILDGPTGELQEQMLTLADEQEAILNKEVEAENGSLEAIDKKEALTRLWIEKGLIMHWYTEDTKAYSDFQKAQETSGFRFKVTGALGKRTKFQQFDTSQLVVVAESSREMASSRPSAYTSQAGSGPKNLTHNDDTVLEKIQFSELTEEDRARLGDLELDPSKEIKDLHPIDHALLLAFCLNIKNTNPAHGLTVEQMFPFVTRVLETPNNWTVYTMALLLRSRLESDKSRTVERGALQLQALVDQTRIEDETSTTRERMDHFFSVMLPSKWEMEKELAEQYMALGVIRSALDIFERLELWEDVIACHQFLSQPEKAKALCKELLEKNPKNAKLYCILGMQLEDFEVAVEAFTKVVSLDQNNGEAWNNLAAIHMHNKNNFDAQHALRQALKEKRESWKIWSNYMYCSLDIGDFTEAIRGMGQVVELRWKSKKEDQGHEDIVNVAALDRIVQGVTRDLKDLYSRSVAFQAQRVEELLLGITNRITTDPKIWKICGSFYFSQKNYPECLECHLKAYRAVIHNPKIETDQAEFEKAVDAAVEMVDWYRNLGPLTFKDTEGKDQLVAKDWAYRSKQMIKSLMARTRDTWEEVDAFEKLKDTMESLKSEK
ncbi:hypothetical protein BGW38_000459 [Lunasporangiospora selenospora]|uniref:TPR-like protein n=1 Tax=Lunasporangiospora selenospora TaxID=979761 RepID=A0A9P6FX12_9FUNG|nr:hypothetical protein BGW38_000459 [Lunasporangiospora selenospora]